ncbi:hypothetical protein QQZ08_009964 [Neonectria magnoliae]|uniref:Myb transcription factor n=1 Tax=Neonectria magnoliae TaxID=2732573 RepID=A0ABR1HK95_9HYPO
MPPNSKWPDFRLASTLWSLVGSQSSGPDKPEVGDSPPSHTDNHDGELHQQLPLHEERDDERNGSHKAVYAMMNSDERPIDDLGGFDSFEHDAQVDDVLDNDDFGALEMFDSNATEAPFSSQLNASTFAQDSKAPEASMDDVAAPSQPRKSKRDKKGVSHDSSSQPSAEEGSSRKRKKSKRKSSLLAEIPDSLPTDHTPNALQEQLLDTDPALTAQVNDEAEVPSTQPKRKRKSSDAAEGKHRKKKKTHDEEAASASQDIVQGTQDIDLSDAQNSPSAARLQRRGRSRENSIVPGTITDEMDLDSQPNVQVNQAESGDKDLGTDSPVVNGSGEVDSIRHHDVETLAREAWNEHVHGQVQNGGDVYDVPGSPVQVPNPPSSNTKRPRLARSKKAKPTYFEKSPSPEKQEPYADLPSPSAMTPKPRKRAKRAAKKKSETERPVAHSTQGTAYDDGEDDAALQARRTRMAGFTQGRFSDEELSRIAIAIESFRSEHDMTQYQVNDMVHAPGGTTAGDDHAALWARIFTTCPDRHRQKIINTTRKKFHNFVARGTWTPEQDAELRDLIEVHGTKWSKIAGIINRHPEDLRDRYRNYIVCGDAQRKDSWDEEEEARLTKYVMEAMGAIDELRQIQPSRELLKKAYEELIDWQNISERMERTRSRLQCITKWKALNIKTHGKDKLVSHEPDAQISFRLEKARRQIADMPEEERYRLILAIHGTSVSLESKIPWQKLVDKQFRNSWHRLTQMLLWRRLQQTVPGWDEKTVRDCAQALVDHYNQTGGLPEVADENYDDAQEMEFVSHIAVPTFPLQGATNNISEEYVGNSDVEEEHGQLKMDVELDGVPDENIQPDLPVEPMEPIEAVEAIQPDLPVEPIETVQPVDPVETVQSTEPEEAAEAVEPVELVELAEPAPPKATRSAKRSAPGKGRAPRRSAPAKRASSRRAAAPSQDPIEDDEAFPSQPLATTETQSEIDERVPRKKKTPSKFRSSTAVDAKPGSNRSESLMDDMEDLPARVPV